jgi:hypothetical protein
MILSANLSLEEEMDSSRGAAGVSAVEVSVAI